MARRCSHEKPPSACNRPSGEFEFAAIRVLRPGSAAFEAWLSEAVSRRPWAIDSKETGWSGFLSIAGFGSNPCVSQSPLCFFPPERKTRHAKSCRQNLAGLQVKPWTGARPDFSQTKETALKGPLWMGILRCLRCLMLNSFEQKR